MRQKGSTCMSELSTETRAQIVILKKEGHSCRQIAKKLKVSPGTVSKTLSRFTESGNYESRQRTGRPRITTKRTDYLIIRACKLSPRASAVRIQSNLPEFIRKPSARTIRRRLFDSGLKSYKPANKPKLSAKNIDDRLKFCRLYKEWTPEQWESVMFSDESTFTQFFNYNRHIRRPVGKRYDNPTVKFPEKVMVWGSISAAGRGALWFMPKNGTINGAQYLTILKEKLPNFMTLHGCEYFQQDGAPCHGVKPVKQWLAAQKYNLLGPWPGNSPDLNIIENCWYIMKTKVAERHPTSYNDLIQKIKEAWVNEITPDYCMRLAHSMPRRIAEVLKNKGHPTKY